MDKYFYLGERAPRLSDVNRELGRKGYIERNLT
jgi:hypothetical protein